MLTIGNFTAPARRRAPAQLPISGSNSAATARFGIVGVSGSGKTHLATVLSEEFLSNHVPTVIIDPEGAFWGLQSSRDGKEPGYKVVVLGGREGNLDLQPSAGALIADVFMQTKQSFVLDLSNFEDDEAQCLFVAAFAARLYAKNREPVHVIIDECDKFCPQQFESKAQRKALHALKNAVQRGRQRGIGTTLLSQRPAIIHKDVLSQVQCLFAFQCPAPLDQDAIERWMVTRAGMAKEERNQFLTSLAKLPRGTAWAWSPTWLHWLDQIAVRERTCFDSSKTPEIGDASRAPQRQAIDLDALRKAMEATAERLRSEEGEDAVPEDTERLKRRVLELEKKVTEQARGVVEVPVLSDADRADLKELKTGVETLRASVIAEVEKISDKIARIDALVARSTDRKLPAREKKALRDLRKPSSRPKTDVAPAEPAADGEVKLRKGEREILDTLRVFGGSLPLRQLATQVKLKSGGSTIGQYLSHLRSSGYIVSKADIIALTAAGKERTKKPPRLTAELLLELWHRRLRRGERLILDEVIQAGSRGIVREDLAKSLRIDEAGSTFGQYVSHLRSNDLIREDDDRFYLGDALALIAEQTRKAG